MNKIKVLIVDDEMEFATALAERLELRSFASRAAESAEQALAVVLEEGWRPDVAILDLKMPILDGLATLSMLRERLPHLETIMLTGHGSTASGIEGMKRGLFDYLLKPVEIGELVARISEAAARARSKKEVG